MNRDRAIESCSIFRGGWTVTVRGGLLVSTSVSLLVLRALVLLFGPRQRAARPTTA